MRSYVRRAKLSRESPAGKLDFRTTATVNRARAEEKVADLRQAVAAVGRDPDTVSLENIVFLGATRGRQVRSTEDAVADAAVWKQAGASGIAIHSMGMGLKGVTAHLELFGRIASMLALDPPPRMTAPRSPGVSGEPSPGR